MDTTQIIIITVISLLFTIFNLICFATKKTNIQLATLVGMYILFAVTMSSVISLALHNNDLQKRQGKCPEFEKVENVYKLKQ